MKLLDYADRVAELEADTNPFAKIVLAHLKASETRRDPLRRGEWKFRLVRGLYEQGLTSDAIRQLFRLIDWLMELPLIFEEAFQNELATYEEGRTVPYVTSIERVAARRTMRSMIANLLRARFGEAGLALKPLLDTIYYEEQLTRINEALGTGAPLEAVRQLCEEAQEPPKKKPRGKSKKT